MSEIETAKGRVDELLSENKALRNSDMYLYFAYVQKHNGFLLTDEQKKQLSGLPAFETITRVRRSLRGKYPGSDEVEKARFQKMEEYIDEFGEHRMRFV